MRIILLFNLFPEDQKETIISNIKTEVQNGTIAFESSLLNGLINNTDNIELVNIPIFGYYPIQYRKLYYKSAPFYFKGKEFGVNVGFCNLFLYKKWSVYINTIKVLRKRIKANQKEKIVIVHFNLDLYLLKAAISVKKEYSNVSICSIIGDLPEFREVFGKFIFLKKLIRKWELFSINRCLEFIDGYILVSEYMREKLVYANEINSIVSECIYDPSVELKTDEIDRSHFDKSLKYILYTGKTNERYGLMNLIQAFGMLQNNDYRLMICGSGSADDAIRMISKEDKRIIFKGNIDRKEVIELQRNADLLVNPRMPEGRFTRYSFPSKTAEYLASGTPVLLYKLPGIPDEYYQYCFSLNEKDGIDILAQTIDKILSMGKADLKEITQAARQFILKEKSNVVQCKRIIDFLLTITKEQK